MNNITVTVELCQADRDRLDNIINLLGQTPARPASEPQNKPETVTPKKTQPEPDDPAAELPVEPAEPAEPTAPQYTQADVLAKVQSMATPGNPKREQAKAIVKAYAAKVSDIPADKYAEVMEKLNALEVNHE